MNDTKFSRCAKYALIAYWLLLVVSTHYPGTSHQFSVSVKDKSLHFAAYTLLAILCGLYFVGGESWKWFQWAVLIGILATCAGADEITQIPVPGRFCDKLDWIADMVGILTGAGLYVLSQTLYRRTRLGVVGEQLSPDEH